MSLKAQINNLRILKNMIVLAKKESEQRSLLRQGMEYNPGFGNEFPKEEVPTYIHANGYVFKKTKNGIEIL